MCIGVGEARVREGGRGSLCYSFLLKQEKRGNNIPSRFQFSRVDIHVYVAFHLDVFINARSFSSIYLEESNRLQIEMKEILDQKNCLEDKYKIMISLWYHDIFAIKNRIVDNDST